MIMTAFDGGGARSCGGGRPIAAAAAGVVDVVRGIANCLFSFSAMRVAGTNDKIK